LDNRYGSGGGTQKLEVTPCARPGLLPRFRFAAAMFARLIAGAGCTAHTAFPRLRSPTRRAAAVSRCAGGGWGGGWHGGGIGFGIGALAAGALIGAAVSSPYYYGGYSPYYAGYPAYYGGYSYG